MRGGSAHFSSILSSSSVPFSISLDSISPPAPARIPHAFQFQRKKNAKSEIHSKLERTITTSRLPFSSISMHFLFICNRTRQPGSSARAVTRRRPHPTIIGFITCIGQVNKPLCCRRSPSVPFGLRVRERSPCFQFHGIVSGDRLARFPFSERKLIANDTASRTESLSHCFSPSNLSGETQRESGLENLLFQPDQSGTTIARTKGSNGGAQNIFRIYFFLVFFESILRLN